MGSDVLWVCPRCGEELAFCICTVKVKVHELVKVTIDYDEGKEV